MQKICLGASILHLQPTILIFSITCFLKLILLYYGSRREPEEPEDASKGRDVFNEKPPPDELMAVSDIGKSVTTSLPDNVVSSYLLYVLILRLQLLHC